MELPKLRKVEKPVAEPEKKKEADDDKKLKKVVKKKKESDYELPEIPDYERPELEKYERTDFNPTDRVSWADRKKNDENILNLKKKDSRSSTHTNGYPYSLSLSPTILSNNFLLFFTANK